MVFEDMAEKHLKHPFVSFKSFEGIDWLGCGFSTRFGGVSKGCFSTMNMSFTRGDDPEDVMANIRIFAEAAGFKPENIVMPHQCHTANVQIVGKPECGRGVVKPGTLDDVDGQITDKEGAVLYCLGADCVPVFLVDTEKRIISACHAGWRGTINNITDAAIGKMKASFGSQVLNIKALIGPSICQECYEVGEDVARLFMEKYGEGTSDIEFSALSDIIRPLSGSFKDNPSGKYFLSLWEANRTNLIRSGILPQHIEISGICTKCHPDIFFSHRAHGEKRGVNAGFIYIKE